MYYIGLDIGGTKCAASLGKITGNKIEILARNEVKTLPSAAETLTALQPFVEEYKAKIREEYQHKISLKRFFVICITSCTQILKMCAESIFSD